jgi:hypothetical protein
MARMLTKDAETDCDLITLHWQRCERYRVW